MQSLCTALFHTSFHLQKITERFYRNTEKPANEDVAERVFLITEDRINVRYHRHDDHITTSYWEFQKPSNLGEKGFSIVLSPETCISYQVTSWVQLGGPPGRFTISVALMVPSQNFPRATNAGIDLPYTFLINNTMKGGPRGLWVRIP